MAITHNGEKMDGKSVTEDWALKNGKFIALLCLHSSLRLGEKKFEACKVSRAESSKK